MSEEYNKNPDGSYMNKEQIVEDLPAKMSKEDLMKVTNMIPDDLIMLHHGLGTWIRNSYGLWTEDYPHIPTGSNADDFSFEVIQEFHRDIQPIQSVTID